MGYTTKFAGEFSVTPPLAENHQKYLEAFSEVRHVKRKKDVELFPDPLREAVGLPVGSEGAYFVGDYQDHNHELDDDDDVRPPKGQPNIWCHWVPIETGESIVWNESEKFYNYVEWIKYLIKHFLLPWGYTLDGEVLYEGEHRTDKGIIKVVSNKVSARKQSPYLMH